MNMHKSLVAVLGLILISSTASAATCRAGTGRVGMPSGEAVAGVIAGGMAERGSQILTRQAESEPYKQVEVYQHEVVSILFVDPVMTNDARSSSLSSGISPSVNRTSQAEQRSQARMQTAMEQRKAVMQRRYDEQPETP